MAPPRRRAARAPRDVAMVARAAADAEDAPVAAAPPIGRDVTFGRRAEMLRAKKESSRDLDANDAAGFWGKIKAAFAIFFPPSEEETARIEAKKRLRMILVADRCAMSGAAMQAMKEKIVDVVREFAEVDDELGVEVSMSQDPEVQGTMYSLSIPVKRVNPEFDVENETYGWDEEPVEYDDTVWSKAGEEEEEEEEAEAAAGGKN
ncbi:uncharacterized protein MICPUCDRAFT_54085 [Micromonas pusilla CCMP1545]|uniref:Predicted protein n=2 Tax=Micromonas pusilla TaxID=38833 RepID=C1N8H3_MICPC|nr:uncharacterized protein MICPUCDRAFT_54085 [Micromonas pusilla CCMP1545]EEH51889.1 predicted protein [Micromonas pusilla CCMP1545]|eukprot:XP_003064267.1 predicted protein [Micromonas pusilla CCMP1545]